MIKSGHDTLFRLGVAILTACAFGATTSSAEVAYVDLEDFYFGPRGPAIDIDGDQLPDFRFSMGMDCPSGCSAGVGGLAGGEIACFDDWAANGLPPGASIGPELSYCNSAALAVYDAGGCYAGDWCEQASDLFVGMRFTHAGGTHYGWFRTRNISGIRVLDCAFETDADTPIVAGDGWPCPDVDADGQVGLSDLATLLTHFGSDEGNSYATGDLNGDGSVDLDDLALLLAEFGTICS